MNFKEGAERVGDFVVDSSYRNAIRPWYFRYEDPEDAHIKSLDFFGKLGRLPPAYRKLVTKIFTVDDDGLGVSVWGVNFPKKAGIAAGYCRDANPDVVKGLKCLDPACIVVGSVTEEARRGNKKPRTHRWDKQESIINHMGLPGPGLSVVVNNLKQLEPRGQRRIPVGVSVVGSVDGEGHLGNPFNVLNGVWEYADFLEMNISCPNEDGHKRTFEVGFDSFARKIGKWKKGIGEECPPLILKLSPDHEEQVLLNIVDSSLDNGFSGFVVSNSTERRPAITDGTEDMNAAGGFSGPYLRELSTQMISTIRGKYPGVSMFGVGGISNYEHVKEYEEAGAEAFQLFTGMIFVGPGIFRGINREILRDMKRRGVDKPGELVGTRALEYGNL